MLKGSNELTAFADSHHGTSLEIAAAIFGMDVTPKGRERLWANPTDEEKATILAKAWDFTPEDEPTLAWAGVILQRPEPETQPE